MGFQGGGLVAAVLFGNVDVFMENFSPFVISWMCIAKFMNFMYNCKQVTIYLTLLIIISWMTRSGEIKLQI